MLKVAKFGGSSLADSERFLCAARIIRADDARRVIVVSAPGKRHAADHKITDLLYLCHAHARCGVPCWDLFRHIRDRFLQIRDGCSLSLPIEQDLDAIYASMQPDISRDFLASRGEYLSAKLLADLLGFSFVDAADWLKFDSSGHVLTAESYAALQTLADGRKIVTPGFYGALASGAIRTFSRGGSDVTGSLAAAALHADLCENWTDVPGVLAADPRLVPDAAPIGQLRYDELQLLSDLGLQVLHSSAVEPLRAAGIPLLIRSTFAPQLCGTRIAHSGGSKTGIIALAGVRHAAMLRLAHRGLDAAVLLPNVFEMFKNEGIRVLSSTSSFEKTTLLLRSDDARERLHAVCERLSASAELTLQEDLAVLAVLLRGTPSVPQLLAAVQGAGVGPVHIAQNEPCVLLAVDERRLEAALNAACRAI